MALSKGTSEDAAMREDSQIQFAKSFVDFLKQHREVLPTLPEMLERLISIEASESQNFDLSREDEKRVLAKRKKADLYRHHKSLQDEITEKNERIMQLEDELHKKTKELEKLCQDREEEVNRWKNYCTTIKSSSDEYIKDAEAKEEKHQELTDRITSLESELKSKDKEMDLIKANKEEQIREYKNRFDKLKKQYEEASSRKDQDLKELNFNNEDLTQQIRTKDDQVKEYEANYTQLKEKYRNLLGVLENKEKELNLVASSNNQLGQELFAKDEQVKEYIAGCTQLKERYGTFLAEKEKELNLVTTSNNQLGQQIHAKDEQVKEWMAGCKQLKFILANKEEELKGMKTRLAYLSEKQVKKDQRKVEDTNASNRPSDVERDFAAFMDEDRIDAFDKMQEVYGSEEEIDVSISYPRLACIIFEASYEQTKETKEAVLALFKGIIATMIDTAPKMGQKFSSSVKNKRWPCDIHFKATEYNPESDYPTDVLDALELSMKESAHECNLESLEQDVKEKIKEKWLLWLNKDKSCDFSFSYSLLKKLSHYIKACIRLTWRMVTQAPPMHLEYQSSTLTEIHKNLGYHSSPEMCSRRPTNEQASDEELEIACYLWPALLDGGGKLIRAGEVLCKVKVENTVI